MILNAIGIGLWAYLFTHELTKSGEIFAYFARATNLFTSGEEEVVANPDKLKGWRLLLWKWTYCEKCHAGAMSLLTYVISFEYLMGIPVFVFISISMFSSILARKIIKGV